MKAKTSAHRGSTRNLLACALAGCMLAALPQAHAQSTGATIRGQVSADSAPTAGATVTATNTATGLVRKVQSSANGSYSLGGLPPGTYRIDVSADGKSNTQNITVQVGQTATLNLGVGGVAETAPAGEATTLDTVSVTAVSAVETKTSEVATYVSQRQIQALPQASRNFLAFADTVPGMVFETSSNQSTKLRSGGQSANGVNVFIDGVGQKSYTLAGGISGQTQSQGNPFPQLAIGEYKVITSNYKAEYDQISSAAVTAVTKSGTNEFHGDLFWDINGLRDWREPTPLEAAQGSKNKSNEEQYGAALGGPIIQDKLFFFVTYEGKQFVRPRVVRSDSNVDRPSITPEIASYYNAESVPFNEDLWFGKLTWQADDANLVELSMKRRMESEVTGVGDGPSAPSFGKTNDNDSDRYDLRYQFSGVNWLNDAHVTYEDDAYNPRAVNIANGMEIIDFTQATPPATPARNGTYLRLGGGTDFQIKGQRGTGFQDDLTFTGLEGHTMKMGVKYKNVTLDSFEQQPFNPTFRYDLRENLLQGNSAIADLVPYEVEFAPDYAGRRNIESKNKQYGVYFQDDWAVTEQLLLNLGLRYDYETSSSFEDYVTPQAIVDSLRAWPNLNNANVDYDYNDYISTGKNRKPFKDAWQPRIGFSYDLSNDQRHVVFGGAGRAYDRNLFDYLALEQSKGAFPGYTYQFNSPNHPCTPGAGSCLAFDPSYYDRENLYALIAGPNRAGGEVYLTENELKVPYSDQYSLGMRNTFTFMDHDWNTSAALSYVESHDGILFSLGNRRENGEFFPPGASFGNNPGDFKLPGFGSIILGRNAVETRIGQVLLSLDKPFSKQSPWGVTVAYTYSDAKENRGNAANRDEHFSFDYPDLEDVAFVPSVGISKHRLVATGIAEYWGLQFSAKLTLATPPGKDGLNCRRQPNIVPNCGIGVFETYYFDDARQRQLDIAIQKEFDTGSDLKMRIRGDIFNVTNDHSYVNYDTSRWNDQGLNPNFGNRSNDEILANLPRTFKLSLGFSW